MILDRSTENIKEIKWSDINAVLNDIADYFLKKFENKSNIRESLLHQFEGAVNQTLMGINLQDYLKTGNCSLELVAKYNKLLNIKDRFCSCNVRDTREINVEKELNLVNNLNEKKLEEKDSIKEEYSSNDVEEVIEKEEIKQEDETKDEQKLDNTAEIEGYIKKIEERQKDGRLIHMVDSDASMEDELAEDYSAIAELLEDEDIAIKTK